MTQLSLIRRLPRSDPAMAPGLFTYLLRITWIVLGNDGEVAFCYSALTGFVKLMLYKLFCCPPSLTFEILALHLHFSIERKREREVFYCLQEKCMSQPVVAFILHYIQYIYHRCIGNLTPSISLCGHNCHRHIIL